jgi:hypothetical protein
LCKFSKILPAPNDHISECAGPAGTGAVSGELMARPRDNVVQANLIAYQAFRFKRFGHCGSTAMYLLSSYVLGGVVTALALTPFVSTPDRSFVGTLLATSAPEITISVNRTLKGDRRAPASLVAERAAQPQGVVGKSTRSGATSTPASFMAPRNVPGTPQTAPRITKDTPAAKSKLLEGCESAFSAITDRQLADIPGRCMAALPGAPVRLATLN